MAITDIAGNPLAPATLGQMLGFVEVSTAEALTLDMYRFLHQQIRTVDEKDGNLFVRRLFDGPQDVWKTTQGHIFDIRKLWSITEIPDEFLQYLKNIVGWTKEEITKRVTDNIDDFTLRRLISISVPFWKTRGPEDSIINILQALTGSRLRIWNWFDFRWVLDETDLSENRQGRDPWVIELPEDGDDSHRFNVRIVDPVLPEPLNRDLVVNLLKLMRPAGERIEVSYIDFLDLFTVAGDASQWDLAEGTALEVVDGLLKLSDTGLIERAQISDTAAPNSPNWTTGFLVYMRARSNEVGAIGLRFLDSGGGNHYEARISIGSFPTPATVTLLKTTATVPTTLASVSLLQAVTLGEFVGFRVNIEPEGATNRIKVYVDGDEVVEAIDPDHNQGTVSLYHLAGADLEVDEIEVFQTPLVTDTIDINAV